GGRRKLGGGAPVLPPGSRRRVPGRRRRKRPRGGPPPRLEPRRLPARRDRRWHAGRGRVRRRHSGRDPAEVPSGGPPLTPGARRNDQHFRPFTPVSWRPAPSPGTRVAAGGSRARFGPLAAVLRALS